MSKFFYTVIIISFMSLIIFPQYLFANNNTSDNIYCEIISCGQKYSINNTQIVIEKNDNITIYTLKRGNKTSLFDEVMLLTVAEVLPGVAQVYRITKNGCNSRWGEAKFNGKCWVGSDFQICFTKE